MLKKSTQFTDYFLFKNLSEFTNLKHFVSSSVNKTGNSHRKNFNISLESDMQSDIVLSNRRKLTESVDIPLRNFVMQNQVHGNNITIIEKSDRGKGAFNHSDAVQNSDAMITDQKNICLFLFAADCMPVLIFDPKKEVIAAVHSGWKGTVLKIAQKTILKMEAQYNSSPEDIRVAIGPSVSVENYETGSDVVSAVVEAFGTKEKFLQFNKASGKYHFDLWYSIKHQLLEAGILENNIEFSGYCTYKNNDLFFSARQKDTGRFGAGIMLA